MISRFSYSRLNKRNRIQIQKRLCTTGVPVAASSEPVWTEPKQNHKLPKLTEFKIYDFSQTESNTNHRNGMSSSDNDSEMELDQSSVLQSFEQWLNTTESDRGNDPVAVAAVTSLRQSLLDKLDQQPSSTDKWLTEAIKQTKAVFTCSGVIDTGDNAAPIDPIDGTTRPRSVQLAFKSPNSNPSSSGLLHDAETCYLSLPLPASAQQSEIDLMMSRILSLCQPAKFGLGGRTCSIQSIDHAINSALIHSSRALHLLIACQT